MNQIVGLMYLIVGVANENEIVNVGLMYWMVGVANENEIVNETAHTDGIIENASTTRKMTSQGRDLFKMHQIDCFQFLFDLVLLLMIK